MRSQILSQPEIRLRTASETGEREELARTLEELRRVAGAHEAYVALLPERVESRGSGLCCRICAPSVHVGSANGKDREMHRCGRTLTRDLFNPSIL